MAPELFDEISLGTESGIAEDRVKPGMPDGAKPRDSPERLSRGSAPRLLGHQAGRPRSKIEAGARDRVVRGGDQPAPVQVGDGVGRVEAVAQDRVVARRDQSAVVDVRVTDVALPVTVGVELAVPARVPDHGSVGDIDAVVLPVVRAVAIGIRQRLPGKRVVVAEG